MHAILSKLKNLSLKAYILGSKYFPYLCVLALAVAFDHFIIYKLKQADSKNKKEIIQKMTEGFENINTSVNKSVKSLNQDMEDLDDKLNARVDIIDNVINTDDKRRELIIRIRKAIEANTNRNLGARTLNNIANAVIDNSYQYNLTIPQVLAQIATESDFDSTAVSHARAKGLMQIIPETLVYIQSEMPDAPSKLNPFNIYHNIKAGCFYMDEQIKEFGDYEQALMAYNWGPHRVRAYNAGDDIVVPKQTQEYVPKILNYIEEFKKFGLE